MPNQEVVMKVFGQDLVLVRKDIITSIGSNWRHLEWTTKDERKIHICDMDNQHLLNSIYHVIKREREDTEPRGLFKPEASSTHLLAILNIEAAYRGLLELNPFDIMRVKEPFCQKVIKARLHHRGIGI